MCFFDENTNRRQAAKAWLKAHPQALDTWLAGSGTLGRSPGTGGGQGAAWFV